jgi:hypothetical protein
MTSEDNKNSTKDVKSKTISIVSPIIDLNAERENRIPHSSGAAKCISCKHDWIAVVPLGTEWFECPNCGLMKGKFKYTHLRVGDKHWTCRCENDLFHITPSGTYCPNCGVWQKF